jgi:hypothetical protein
MGSSVWGRCSTEENPPDFFKTKVHKPEEPVFRGPLLGDPARAEETLQSPHGVITIP